MVRYRQWDDQGTGVKGTAEQKMSQITAANRAVIEMPRLLLDAQMFLFFG